MRKTPTPEAVRIFRQLFEMRPPSDQKVTFHHFVTFFVVQIAVVRPYCVHKIWLLDPNCVHNSELSTSDLDLSTLST